MHIVERSAESLTAAPAPLFASSWVALYLLIRERLLLPAPPGPSTDAQSGAEFPADDEPPAGPRRH